jgi:hypothetical protein
VSGVNKILKSLYLQWFAAMLFSEVHILHMVIVDGTTYLLAEMLADVVRGYFY